MDINMNKIDKYLLNEKIDREKVTPEQLDSTYTTNMVNKIIKELKVIVGSGAKFEVYQYANGVVKIESKLNNGFALTRIDCTKLAKLNWVSLVVERDGKTLVVSLG